MRRAALLVLLLVGCAAPASLPLGVRMSAAEAQTCRSVGCTVWTEAELLTLMAHTLQKACPKGSRI